MPTREENLRIDLRHNNGDFEATQTGDISRISGLDNLKQAVMHRLITVKGSLAHRPDYGVGIQNYQGQIPTIDKQRDLALNIRDQLLRDDRIVSVDSVSFTASDTEPDKFIIYVKYSALGYTSLEDTFDPFGLGV